MVVWKPRRILFWSALLVVAAASPVQGQTPAVVEPGQAVLSGSPQDLQTEVARLREQLEILQQRLAALEQQVAQAAAPPAAAGAQVPPGAAAAGGPEGQLPIYGSPPALSKVFNPDIAAIGNFTGAAGRNLVDPRPALDLEEAELTFQAIVDPYARADFFLSGNADGVELEEGFITFPTRCARSSAR
jgi:hypothetical protein